MCKHGHEQMDFIEEEAEGIIEGSTRRHIKSNKRISKRKQERENRLHGEDANFILVQGMQFIIKLQATKLAEIANLPDPFVETVKKLWLLYVSKLDDVNKDMTERDVQNMYLSAHSQDKWAQGSSQESAGDFSQPSQETAVDSGSLDFLMQKVDEDIAKDVEEMRLWEQQDESPVATHNTYMEAPQNNSDNEDML
ncbi:Pol I core factor CF, partial [Coemansia sp. RSA 1290]